MVEDTRSGIARFHAIVYLGRPLSAVCLSHVHSMTHPTLRSKTTTKSAAIGGNATSALFDLSWTAMLYVSAK